MTEAAMDDVDVLSEEGLLSGIDLAMQPPSDPCAHVLVAGDICMAYAGGSCCTSEPSVPWSGLGDSIASHGFRIVNLECPLTLSSGTIMKSGPHLRAHPSAASIVQAGCFDVVDPGCRARKWSCTRLWGVCPTPGAYMLRGSAHEPALARVLLEKACWGQQWHR